MHNNNQNVIKKFIFKDNKKTAGSKCTFIEDECDQSKGLECLNILGDSICSCNSTQFYSSETEYSKNKKIFLFFYKIIK